MHTQMCQDLAAWTKVDPAVHAGAYTVSVVRPTLVRVSKPPSDDIDCVYPDAVLKLSRQGKYIISTEAKSVTCRHKSLTAPHPVRSAKLSRVSPSQYCAGGPRRCCSSFSLSHPSFSLSCRSTSLISTTFSITALANMVCYLCR